jgi:hypothetical protein
VVIALFMVLLVCPVGVRAHDAQAEKPTHYDHQGTRPFSLPFSPGGDSCPVHTRLLFSL